MYGTLNLECVAGLERDGRERGWLGGMGRTTAGANSTARVVGSCSRVVVGAVVAVVGDPVTC
jgi:hypothetical protein